MIFDKMSLASKTAVVTGAAHGIGKACALALAQAGADVMVVDINEKVADTAEEIRQIGRKAISMTGDITDEKQMTECMDRVLREWDKVDICFCNAGTFQDIPAEDMPLEEFERVIRVNLTGAFITARAAGKTMIERGVPGSIVLTASMSGHIANIPQCQCAYNASKAGVIMLGKSLAVEWARHGIRVNTISPGYIRTWSDEPLKPEEVGTSNFEQWTPLRRFGQAEELQGLVVYLAGDASGFVTGSDYVIDGGYTAF
ncbi:MAG: SDR family oxidoreductase [Hungatella sp.]|jgi:NAD(P)-dependent dehydrogenase (short-subunit alcohol dehydrogenase family)|nr:SDR family oxidoreductase [Hungatella sp.]